MKKTILIEIVLVLGLSFSAAKLVERHNSIKGYAASIHLLKNHMRIDSLSGVNIWGSYLDVTLSSATKCVIVFVIRGTDVSQELSFWNEVSGLLKTNDAIHLFGFCDGTICTESIINTYKPQSFAFSLMKCCDVISAQAITNADSQGYALLIDNKLREIRRIRWRNSHLTASAFAQRVLQCL
jgi:hypothetical protein